MNSLKTIISLLANVALIVLVADSVIHYLHKGGQGNMEGAGSVCFRYFTNDSNILCALCCAPLIFFGVKGLASGSYDIPKWALLLKFTGTVAVAVTMMTVLVFLGPTQGYGKMFAGKNLYLHLVCPLLAIVSLCLTEGSAPVSFSESLLGLLPTLVYGLVYAILVLVKKVWPDFYGFNRGGLWYVSCAALPVGTLALCLALMALHNAVMCPGV